MSEQLSNALAQLAAQLGTTVPYLWRVMVEGVAMRATADMIGYAVFGLILAKAAHAFLTRVTEGEGELLFLRCVGALMAFAALLPIYNALACATDFVVALTSPEYVALEHLLRLAR